MRFFKLPRRLFFPRLGLLCWNMLEPSPINENVSLTNDILPFGSIGLIFLKRLVIWIAGFAD